MDSTTSKKDIVTFKQAIEEAHTAENGWEIAYDEPLNKKYSGIAFALTFINIFLDCHLKIYKKKMECDDTITTFAEATFTNVAAEKWFQMMTDIPTILKGESPLKEIKCVEKTSNNSDIVYLEVNLPFPMTNRDFLQKRLFLGNKEDADLVKELGLYDWSHRYYVILNESIERDDVPHKKDVVRAKAKMNHWLIEEDPQSWNKIKVRQVACQEMGGDIPISVVNSFCVKGAHKRMENMRASYTKIFSS